MSNYSMSIAAFFLFLVFYAGIYANTFGPELIRYLGLYQKSVGIPRGPSPTLHVGTETLSPK